MAQGLQEGGVRMFNGNSMQQVESQVNAYLEGDGTIDNPKKVIKFPPSFLYNTADGKFYVLIVYEPLN